MCGFCTHVRVLLTGCDRSTQVHPDKVQAAGGADADEEGADEAFVALKAAYDVLSDTYKRDLYDKFGTQGLDSKDDTTQLLAGLGFFYVMWLTLAYLLTQRKSVGRAQTWGFTGLLALGIFEYQACILSFDFLQDALPQVNLRLTTALHARRTLVARSSHARRTPSHALASASHSAAAAPRRGLLAASVVALF